MLRKYKSLYSSTTNTFSTGESVTITPASVVGLPTDTEITLTFDRVDSSGTKTPSKMERIRGTIVGSNFVVSSGGRAVEGTEQVHTSPVVEMIWNADDWNDAIDQILVEHNDNGTHKSALVTTLKATGAEITTGTEDAKIVTPKAIADAGLVKDNDGTLAANSDTRLASQKAVKTYADTKSDASKTETLTNKTLTSPTINNGTFTGGGALLSKVLYFSKDLSTAGDVAYTGIGFKPTSIIAFASVDATFSSSWAMADSSKAARNHSQYAANTFTKNAFIVHLYKDVNNYAYATIKSYDADGFTLTWTNYGSPTGTGWITVLCLR